MHRRKVTSQCRRNRNCSHIINTFGCRLLCGISIIGTVYTAIVYTTPFTLYHSLLLFTSYSLLLHFFLPFWIDINLTFEWHEIQYPSILVPRDSSSLSPFMPFRKNALGTRRKSFSRSPEPRGYGIFSGFGVKKIGWFMLPYKERIETALLSILRSFCVYVHAFLLYGIAHFLWESSFAPALL